MVDLLGITAGVLRCRGPKIAVEADKARRAGFENRAGVSTEADRAVDEQTAALGL